jgi:phosphatidylinositol-3-phosphatase
MRRCWLVVGLGALVGACGGGRGAAPSSDGQSAAVSATDAGAAATDASRAIDAGVSQGRHVFVIAMENQSAGSVYGSSHAPYLNGVLLPAYAHATNFVDELSGLPSEPHYIQMEAGTNAFADVTFQTDDAPSATNSTASPDHLASQLRAAGGDLDWMAYVEGVDLSAEPCPIAGAGTYVPRHDPFLFFQDVSGAPPAKTTPLCTAHHKPLAALADDLAAGTLASYVFITPNLCHDMHGSSSCPSADNVQMGDTWLSTAMPPLIDYVNAVGGVIFIIWDEENHVPFFAIGPDVKAGYGSPVALTHRSLLKTVEEIFGLPILPTVQDANDFGDLFVSGTVR